MLKKKPNENKFEIIDILERAQIIYSDGKMDNFQAIHITDKGIYTGRIVNNDEFISGGFIPKQNVKKIIGGSERKVQIRKSRY